MQRSRVLKSRCVAVLLAAVAACAIAGLSGCGGPPPKRTPGSASMGAAPLVSMSKDAEIESIEAWTYNGREGRIFRTPHYRVFTTQPDTVLNARLPVFLEQALVHYRTTLTGTASPLPQPSIKLDTYVLANRGDWSLLTRQLTGDLADVYLRIPRGGFAFGGKALLFDIGQRDTLAISAHEGWHQYTQRAFAQPLPMWLEEGLATYMEGHRFDARGVPVFKPWINTERFDALRRARASKQTMGLAQLLGESPGNLLAASQSDDALVYYAQVWALTHFLAEGADGRHRSQLARLLKDAAEGSLAQTLRAEFGNGAERIVAQRRGPVVFEAYFGDVRVAAAEYEAFLDEVVRAGSRELVVAGESPIANGDNRVR